MVPKNPNCLLFPSLPFSHRSLACVAYCVTCLSPSPWKAPTSGSMPLVLESWEERLMNPRMFSVWNSLVLLPSDQYRFFFMSSLSPHCLLLLILCTNRGSWDARTRKLHGLYQGSAAPLICWCYRQRAVINLAGKCVWLREVTPRGRIAALSWRRVLAARLGSRWHCESACGAVSAEIGKNEKKNHLFLLRISLLT